LSYGAANNNLAQYIDTMKSSVIYIGLVILL
jgi:hypothetical protein